MQRCLHQLQKKVNLDGPNSLMIALGQKARLGYWEMKLNLDYEMIALGQKARIREFSIKYKRYLQFDPDKA